MAMLRMTDMPKRKRHIPSPEEIIIQNKDQGDGELLTIAALPKRGRQRPTLQEMRAKAIPQKILTLNNLPSRSRAMRRVTAAARRAQPMIPGGRLNPGGQRQESSGPRMFGDYVCNGIWKGRRCFIIGGGPSLKNVDLSVLKGELVIGINRAYEICDPSILFGVDGQLWGWVEKGQCGEQSRRKFGEYKGYKAWMALYKIVPLDLCLINVDSSAGHKVGTTKKLSFKNNSGYGAINLAAALGAKQIYLLGFDMRGNRQGKQKWWHSGYPIDYGENIYTRYIKELNAFAPVLQKAGVEVVNLTKRSVLKCFPSGDLDKVIAAKPKRPMVVSFYTTGTGYEKEANRLMEELHLFGFEYDVEGILSFGSWQKNTQYKAKFIAGMMEKYPRRDILWLDVDSSIYQYPDLFDNANFDLGVHEIDWAKYTHGARKDKQLANAVIYLKNIDPVRRFVQDWIALNEKCSGRIEMVTMADVLSRWKDKLNFRNIPASYCQIFDSMALEGYPVIEQRQASRRYRIDVGKTDKVAELEKKKYDDCWTSNYKRSRCAEPLINLVLKTMKKDDRVLDIGCGDCTTLLGLRKAGVDCMGVDITLKGAPKNAYGIFEAPVWDMPFDDGQFDYTVSTDVLEHVPTDKMQATIKEILRVTRRKTFHVVALFDGIRNGVILHMTVKPMTWWQAQFDAAHSNGVDATVMSRNVFMAGKK